MTKKVKKLVLAASGFGTRFLPITTSLPKEMFPIIDKPVFQYVLEEGLIKGIEELILVVSKDKWILLDYIKRSKDKNFQKLLKSVKITIVYRKPELLGNAAPVLSAKKYLKDDPFVVLWADSFGLRKDNRIGKMLSTYLTVQKPVVCLFPFFERARYIYAVPKVEKVSKDLLIVKRIFEKPGNKKIASPYCFGNGYLLEPNIFDYIERLKPTEKGELVLEEAVDAYCQKNLTYGMVFRDEFFEAGNKQDFIKTSLKLLLYREDLKDSYFQILEELHKEVYTSTG